MNRISIALLAGAFAMAGCISNSARVRAEMERLVSENRFDDARNILVKSNPGGIPKTDEEKMRDKLIVSLVNPEEAKFVAHRIKALRDSVLADLKAGKDADARKHIYEYGVIVRTKENLHLQPTANGLVFAAKCGLLNSRVNPAAWKRISSTSEKSFSDALKAGDYEKANDIVKGLKMVPAYPDAIDPLLAKATEEAVAQRCEKEGSEALVAMVKEVIYSRTAFREGYEKTDFVPKWEKLDEYFASVRDALVDDDVPPQEAQKLVDDLLVGIKALFVDDATGENLTTAQLNEKIIALRADLLSQVNNALAAAIASAKAGESERLRRIQLAVAEQALAAVDAESRISAFVGAIDDHAEPGINRILGDAARVLRLSEAGLPVQSGDANSLLIASIYMGFADTAKLALALNADLNGVSPKDDLARTPFLISLQYQSAGPAAETLAPANKALRDANGYGAVHYAVRYARASTLQRLLDLGLDAKAPAKDGVTPLMVAADLSNPAFAQALIPLSNVNAADEKGRTALHFAAAAGSLPIVRALVRSQASANVVTKDGDSPLDLAVALPGEAVISFLLDEAKVKPDERAIDWCAINGKVMPLTTLISHGGMVTDKHLAVAAKCGHLDMVKYLVSLGCDVNADSVHKVCGIQQVSKDIIDFLRANGYRDDNARPDFVK